MKHALSRFAILGTLVIGGSPASARPPAGTALQELAASLQPGQWAELPTQSFGNGSVLIPAGGGGGGILEYCDELQWNPITRSILAMGTQRPYGPGNQGWVRYDEVSNAWITPPPLPFYLGYHSYDGAALDPATGDYYYVTGGQAWRHSGGSWTAFPPPPMGIPPDTSATEYFPEMGGVVFQNGRDNGEVWLYSAGAWRKVAGGFATGEIHNVTIYSAKRKVLFFGGGDDSGYYPDNQSVMMYSMDGNGSVTRLPDAPVAIGVQTSVNTVDPVTGNLLVFARDRNVYEYGFDTQSWSQKGPHDLLHRYGSFACGGTPIPEYGVVLFVKFDYDQSKVLVYKHSAGSVVPPPIPAPLPAPPPADGSGSGACGLLGLELLLIFAARRAFLLRSMIPSETLGR